MFRPADAERKVGLIQLRGKVILDTCCGLGYFAYTEASNKLTSGRDVSNEVMKRLRHAAVCPRVEWRWDIGSEEVSVIRATKRS